jgi:hypothetical protein
MFKCLINKLFQTASRDSDSLIQDNFSSGMFDPSKSCWKHPKIRENWKMVLAAVVLLLIGIGKLYTQITNYETVVFNDL